MRERERERERALQVVCAASLLPFHGKMARKSPHFSVCKGEVRRWTVHARMGLMPMPCPHHLHYYIISAVHTHLSPCALAVACGSLSLLPFFFPLFLPGLGFGQHMNVYARLSSPTRREELTPPPAPKLPPSKNERSGSSCPEKRWKISNRDFRL